MIQAQVEEIRRRQRSGLIDPDLDPGLVRLFGFALASYPHLLPQITRMTTGTAPDDTRFAVEWEAFLRCLGALLRERPMTHEGERCATRSLEARV